MRKLLASIFNGGSGHSYETNYSIGYSDDYDAPPIHRVPSPASPAAAATLAAAPSAPPSSFLFVASPSPPPPPAAGGSGRVHLTDSALARQLAAEEEEAYRGGATGGGGLVADHHHGGHGHGQHGGHGHGSGRVHLTDSALARRLAEEENDSAFAQQLLRSDVATASDAFSVTVNCPYDRCWDGRNIALGSFVSHVVNQHAHESHHKYACPVCTLSTGETYTVHDNTNLLTHLQSVHSAEAPSIPPSTTSAPSTQGDNTRTVHCPYIGCVAPSVPKRSFTTHVSTFHQTASSHKYACPLCFLATGHAYTVHDNTDLRSHLQSVHSNEDTTEDLSYEELLELEERIGSVTIAPSTNIIDQLPTHTFSKARMETKNDQEVDEELQTCSICLTEYEDGDVLRTLPCVHFYHQACIDAWLSKHKECPVCKFDITTTSSF